MKLVCMLLFTVSTIFTGITEETTLLDQETKTIVATYVESKNYDFYFTTSDKKITFHKVDENATKKIDFTDSKLQGQSFKIEYTEEAEKTEGGDDYTYRTILSIEPATP